jgi:hypothetical protein
MSIRKIDLITILQKENYELDESIQKKKKSIDIQQQQDLYNQTYLDSIQHFNLVLCFLYYIVLFVFAFSLYWKNQVTFYNQKHLFALLLVLPFANSIVNMIYTIYQHNSFYTITYKKWPILNTGLSLYIPSISL